MEKHKSWTVEVEAELQPLLPTFIESRWRDLEKLRVGIQNADFQSLYKIGHSLRGVPGAFGFNYLVELGARIQADAKHEDVPALRKDIERFESFMTHHEVRFNSA